MTYFSIDFLSQRPLIHTIISTALRPMIVIVDTNTKIVDYWFSDIHQMIYFHPNCCLFGLFLIVFVSVCVFSSASVFELFCRLFFSCFLILFSIVIPFSLSLFCFARKKK